MKTSAYYQRSRAWLVGGVGVYQPNSSASKFYQHPNSSSSMSSSVNFSIDDCSYIAPSATCKGFNSH